MGKWESLSTDSLEQQLIAHRALRSRLDAADMEILEELDRRQIATVRREAAKRARITAAEEPPPAQITVFVDAKEAAPSSTEAGVVLEAGSKVGETALQALLCDSVVEVTARASDGTPMVYGRRHRSIDRDCADTSSTGTAMLVLPAAVRAGTASKSTIWSIGPTADPQTPQT